MQKTKILFNIINTIFIILYVYPDDIFQIENFRYVAESNEKIVKLIDVDDNHRMQKATAEFDYAATLLGVK